MTYDPETLLELELIESDPYGREVRASVRCRGFTGLTTAFLGLDDLAEFEEGLVELDEIRKGSVELGSMTPGELRLRFFAMDAAGHLALEGELAKYSGLQIPPVGLTRRCDRVEFGFQIDPSCLRDVISWVHGHRRTLRIVENST